jgi:hypothetical protein
MDLVNVAIGHHGYLHSPIVNVNLTRNGRSDPEQVAVAMLRHQVEGLMLLGVFDGSAPDGQAPGERAVLVLGTRAIALLDWEIERVGDLGETSGGLWDITARRLPRETFLEFASDFIIVRARGPRRGVRWALTWPDGRHLFGDAAAVRSVRHGPPNEVVIAAISSTRQPIRDPI